MFKAKEKGLNAKVVNRNLIVDNTVFHVGNIPDELKTS